MSRSNIKKVAIALAITGFSAFLTGCGSAPPAGVLPPGAAAPYGGQYGMPAGCLPINGPIGFNANGIFFNGTTVKAGTLMGVADPNYYVTSSYTGTVTLMAGGAAGTYNTLPGRADGSMSMNIISGAAIAGQYNPNPTGAAVSATGYLNLSPAKQQQIMYGSGVGYQMLPTTPGAAPMTMTNYCVSALAFSLGIGNGTQFGGSATTLYNGVVVLSTTLGPITLRF
jgi:hypothetical protein